MEEATCTERERIMLWKFTKDFVFNYETVKILLYHVNVIS